MTGPVFSYWQFGGQNESGRQGQESPQRPWEDSKMAPFARTAAVLTGAAMLAAAPFLAGPALAQADYPSRPVELIVTFGPGGGSDVPGRQIARQLEPLPAVDLKSVGEGKRVAVRVDLRGRPFSKKKT